MSFLVYLLYTWFRNTRALQVVIGLLVLGLIYVVTKNLGLLMTSWVFQELGTVLFVLIIVIFQTEIRQALYRFSLLSNLFERPGNGGRLDFMALSTEIFSLASVRTGALLVFQRRDHLDEYLLHGVPLDSVVTPQLLGTIFRNGTPLHDGAAVIADGRITQASCHLPLSVKAEFPHHYGTRHRAAIGITERSDAVVVVVSEERGEVSLAVEGELQPVHTAEQLSEKLVMLLALPAPEAVSVSVRERLLRDPLPKLSIVLLVIICWAVITARQGGIVSMTIPIKFHNLPDNLAFMTSTPEEVEVRLKFFSSLIDSPKHLDLVADVNLARVKEGANHVPIHGEDIKLPLGVTLTEIRPGAVKVITDRKVRRDLPVRLKTRGKLPSNFHLKKVRIEPAKVTLEGPAHFFRQVSAVDTEELNIENFIGDSRVEVGLVPPSPQVRILRQAPVLVRVSAAKR